MFTFGAIGYDPFAFKFLFDECCSALEAMFLYHDAKVQKSHVATNYSTETRAEVEVKMNCFCRKKTKRSQSF